MNKFINIRYCFYAAALIILLPLTVPERGKQALVVVGIDKKVLWDDAGKIVLYPPGKDMVLIMDIGTDPLAPRIIASFPLMNSIFGPPTNLQITPDEGLALVANSVTMVQDGAAWKTVPDNKLYVIDLKASPPALIDTIEVGKQPSGMSINSKGTRAYCQPRGQFDQRRVNRREKSEADRYRGNGRIGGRRQIIPTGNGPAVNFRTYKVAVLDVVRQKSRTTKIMI